MRPDPIVFEINGDRHEATVDHRRPVRRSSLDVRGQLTVEHPSGSYAIYLDPEGYIARPIVEDPPVQHRLHFAVDEDGQQRGMGIPVWRDFYRYWHTRCSCGESFASKQKPAALRQLHRHLEAHDGA